MKKGSTILLLLLSLIIMGTIGYGQKKDAVIGGVDLGGLTNYLLFFADGSIDANWQAASKGFVGNVAIDGIQASERTSGTVPYAGTIYTNDVTLGAWQQIVNDNPGQAFGSTGNTALISTLQSELISAIQTINALPATTGYSSVSSTSLDGLNTQNGINEVFVINVTSGLQVSSQINITGDAGDVYILRWDDDANPSNGYNGQVKFQSGGAIIPHGGLLASNFINVAGEIGSSGGGSTPPPPYPQGPRYNNGQGGLITGGSDFSGGGFFTGYWLTTGAPTTLDPSGLLVGQNQSLSNGIFVGGWYSLATSFSMTSGTSGVYVAPNTQTFPASLGDFVWNDTNHNGLQDGGEAGIPGVTVELYNCTTNLLAGTTVTDANGLYSFTNLTPGSYRVKFILPTGYQFTTKDAGNDALDSDADPISGETACVTLLAGENNTTIDAGMYPIPPAPASLGDFVWNDVNNNGIQDPGEVGIANVTVQLFDCNNAQLGTTTTDANGFYSFTNLTPGSYTVKFILPSGYVFSAPLQGSDPTKDSDANQTTGETTCITLAAGENNMTIDAGMHVPPPQPASLGDFVWNDTNHNGIQDAGEAGIPGVVVNLLDCNNNQLATTTTNASGIYSFTNLTPGQYTVEFVKPAGYTITLANIGNDATDSDADPITGKTTCITLAAGDNNLTVDAGMYPTPPAPASLGDFVWNDLNHNGIQDAGEPGIPNATVILYNCNSNTPITSTITDASGLYHFTNLAAGSYYVQFILPNGYAFTLQDQGNDALDSDANPTDGKTACVTLAAGDNNTTLDGGMYVPPPQTASVGDFVWNDLNHNGIQDAGEPGIPNVVVNLYTCNDVFVGTTTTDANGLYHFTNLTPGVQYYVQFVLPTGYVFSQPFQGGDNTKDSNADPLTGKSLCFTLAAGENNLTYDAGMYVPPTTATVGDFVWNDLNHNGIQDGGEPGIPNVTVDLYTCADVLVGTTTTNATGYYSFTNLTPGDYYVKFTLPTGFVYTAPLQGGNINFDSNVIDPATGKTACFTLAAGDVNLTIDAGMYTPTPTGSIGDFVWNDLNHNGIQDVGEPGIPYVVVMLYDCNNNFIATTITNTSGYYSFNNLPAGNYKVKFFLPNGYVFTLPDQGTDDAIDSDANVTTGESQCITLASGEHNTTIDAGMYTPCPTCTASLGDFVWNDLNHNGIQDNGEPGIPYVTVTLYTCAGQWVATTTTDANGHYLFTNIAPGSYYVQFMLPNGYSFTIPNVGNDAFDSDANQTTGRTDCINLAAGETNLTVDAGMTLTPPPDVPNVTITKTDGILFMKPVGQNDTYSIHYANIGNADLLNAVLVDTLPPGLSYVSCSGGLSCNETSNGSNIVTFTLGTIPAGGSGDVTVTAVVDTVLPYYLNGAFVGGYDANQHFYWAHAYDLDLADTTSGGGGGGIESNGDLAELLLLRQLKINHGMTTPLLSNSPKSINANHRLQDIIPVEGPLGSAGTEVTPFDILGISNAISAYAMDYTVPVNNVNSRIAAIFSTITAAPNIYDHTKSMCDRLAGTEIQEVKLLDINGYNFYAAKMYNPNTGNTDFAISFSVYETSSGFSVENKWTHDGYVAPSDAQFVYNFQVWSAAYPSTIELVQSILSKFNSFGALTYMNTTQVLPDVFVAKVSYKHTGLMKISIANTTTEPKDVPLNIYYRTTQGSDIYTIVKDFNVQSGITNLEIPMGIIADATVKTTQPTGFKDEVYISGGSYANIPGPLTTVTQFITNNYSQENPSNYPDGSAILAGGAKIQGSLNDWVSVARSLTPGLTAYDLSGYNMIRFTASGTGVLTVLIDLTTTQNFNYYGYNINLTGSDKVYEIYFSSFNEVLGGAHTPLDPSKIRMVAFNLSKQYNAELTSFNFEVKNIVFIPSNVSGNDNTEVPKEFALAQNYPNPFNPSTVIEVSVAKKELLNLSIYNILGQRVMTLVNGELEPGIHKVTFDASNLASGMYIYKLSGKSVNISKKMLFTK